MSYKIKLNIILILGKRAIMHVFLKMENFRIFRKTENFHTISTKLRNRHPIYQSKNERFNRK